MPERKQYGNIIAISGEGRNVGKTVLACNIIGKFSRYINIVGIKITPHSHKDIGKAERINSANGFQLYRETDPRGPKDTSRMLAAGATEAYLIQLSGDEQLKEALEVMEKISGPRVMYVCESGILPSREQVGISLFVRQINCNSCSEEKKLSNSDVDRIVTCTSNHFDMDLNDIILQEDTWKLKKS